MGQSFQLEQYPRCPSCKARLDGATGIGHDHGVSTDGNSIGVCVYCGGVYKYVEGFKLAPVKTWELPPGTRRKVEAIRRESKRYVTDEMRIRARKGG